jgi:N-terminal domain of reverse transcriptase
LDTIMVNGPEDEVLDWDAVDWRQVEGDVRRLRQRIFTASKAGDLKKVRNLQKLMVRHEALVFPDGGGRPRSLRRRSGGDEAGGSLSRGSPGRAGAASTKSRRFSTAGWAGRGERDGKVYERNRLRYAS